MPIGMGMSMSWHGMEEVKARLAQMAIEADKTSRMVLAKSAATVVHAAQDNFSGSHRKGEPHIGGDQPNIVTGYLRRSIRMGVIIRTGYASYATQVGPTAVYGRAIELGLHGVSYPFFGPAVKDTKPELQMINEAAWEDFLLSK